MRRRFPRQVLSFCVVELFLAVAESNTRAGPSATGAARSSRPRNAAKTSACRDDANGDERSSPCFGSASACYLRATPGEAGVGLERAKGIEPSYAAWEAAVLPLNYARAEDPDF